MKEIYSFDIFDTLLTRKTATPLGIFLIVQYKLRNKYIEYYPVNLIEDFYNIRINAENEARNYSEFEDICIDEIYTLIQKRFNLTLEDTAKLKDIELNTEEENIVGVKQNILKVIQLLELKNEVILLSDMYLHSEYLRKILTKIEPCLSYCPIFVSSEQKVTKQTGNLYKLILKEFNITSGQLIHYGDNVNSDFRVPKKMGINAKLFSYKSVSEYEKIYFAEDRLYMQIVAGISKNYRINFPEIKVLERIGTCYSGPLLYTYTEYVLRNAIHHNIKKIYFLSRDGHILFQIAKIIIEKNKLEIEPTYLHVSRQVCYLASLFEITSKECEWIEEFMKNMQTLAKRFDLQPEELLNLINKKSITRIPDIYVELTALNKSEICDLLKVDIDINTLFLNQAKNFRNLFLDYMRQNDLFSDAQIGMVDIGWSGKMQDSIYKTLSFVKSDIRINYYYFGMYKNGWEKFTPYTSEFNRKNYFIEYPMQLRVHATFFEALTSSNHGTTISYKRNENGNVVPVLDDNNGAKKWDIESYQNQILFFVNEFEDLTQHFKSTFNYGQSIAFELFKQAENPIIEIANAIGDIPYTIGHNESSLERLADPIKFYRVIYWGINRKLNLAYWINGALIRSTPIVRLSYHFLVNIRLQIRNYKEKIYSRKITIKRIIKYMIKK